MLSTLGLSYLFSQTNYTVSNTVNIYNSFINILEIVDNETKKKVIRIIKNNIGMSFYTGFKEYINHKYSSDDELFILFNSG